MFAGRAAFPVQQCKLWSIATRSVYRGSEMKGRKPRPTHLRVLDGTRGKIPADRNQPKPAGNLFEPPGDLIAQAIPFWNEAIADAPRGLLKKLDKRALAIWSTAAWLHADSAAKVARSSAIVQSQTTGAIYQHPPLSIT